MSLINGDDNNYYDSVDHVLHTVSGGGGKWLLFLILQTKQNIINLSTRINFDLFDPTCICDWPLLKTYCYVINNFMLHLMIIIFHVRKLAEVLLIENYHISLPEACILDYYVAGFWYPLSFCIESENVCSL